MNRGFRFFTASLLITAFIFSGLILLNRNFTSVKAEKLTVGNQVSEIKFAPEDFWSEFDRMKNRVRLSDDLPENSRFVQIDRIALASALSRVPSEFEKEKAESVILPLPLPDGTFENFRIEESSVLEPDLAALHPQIKSYRGQGVARPAWTTRFDFTPQGFHAIILAGDKTAIIQPTANSTVYASYFDQDLKGGEHKCLTADFHRVKSGDQIELDSDEPEIAVGSTLRTYRIALAATFEYAQTYGGGTIAGTVASFNTRITLTNAIYERDLAVRLVLVNDTDVIYSADRGFTAATDPYDNSNVITMLDQVMPDLQNNVGMANYDLGHVLGNITGGGGSASGVAFIGVVCDNSTFGSGGAIKGGGATLVSGSVSSSGVLGVLIHEFGHQFGADHNMNGTLANCNQRNPATSFESGSGSTIMGYSQICGADNITTVRDLRFHAKSYEAINNYITSSASCSMDTVTGNTPPTVSGGGNRTIPKFTPFTLTATASDVNGDSLTYNWEQIDAGGTTFVQNGTEPSYEGPTDPTNTTRPLFRPLPASTSPSRTFPSLTYILNNANNPPLNDGSGLKIAEELPRVGRTMNFRVTARDNRTGGGGVNEDTVTLTVHGNSGPFLVTSPDTAVSYQGSTTQTVMWSVNNTNNAPVNATNVRILLSTDGGNTFPTVLTALTTNDGSEAVTIPNTPTTTARIKVEAVGNIFFDISNSNFTIVAGPTSASVSVSGRVVNMSGRGISHARVLLTGENGITRYASTNAFGYYRLTDVAAGETYIFSVSHKRYFFLPQVLTVTEEISELNFVAEL